MSISFQAVDANTTAILANGTEVGRVSSYGLLNLKAAAFSATDAGQTAQVVPNITFTKLTLRTEDFDLTSSYDAANSRFTAPVAGVYHFSGAVFMNSSATIVAAHLYKNGAEVKRGQSYTVTGNVSNGSVNADLNLAAGDYVELWVYHNSGANNGVGNAATHTHLSGHLVRAS
jgi:hypothetical protein